MVDLKKIFFSIVGEPENSERLERWNEGTAPTADSTEPTFTNGSDAGALADPSEQTADERPTIPASPDGSTPPPGNPWAAASPISHHGESPTMAGTADGATLPGGNPWAEVFPTLHHEEAPTTAGTAGEPLGTTDHVGALEGTAERPGEREDGAPANDLVCDADNGPLAMTPFGAVVLPEDATPGSLVDDWYRSHEFTGPIPPQYQEGVAGPTPIPRRVTR